LPSTDALHQVRVEEQDLSSSDLTLSADNGESIEILARGISGGSQDDVIEEKVDEVSLLNYQANEGGAEIFPEDAINNYRQDLLGLYRSMGAPLPTIKVPSGTTYTLNNPNDNGTATVIYKDRNDETLSRAQPGGPESNERTFITVGEGVASSVGTTSTTTQEIDTSTNIGGIEPFPYEEDVPSRREYDVMAVMVELAEDQTSSRTLDNVRLNTEEQDFLERSGQLVNADLFQYPVGDWTTLPWLFKDPDGELRPITFEAGSDLTVEVEVTNDDTSSSQDITAKCAIVARERRL
jgi:hypothetical protein